LCQNTNCNYNGNLVKSLAAFVFFFCLFNFDTHSIIHRLSKVVDEVLTIKKTAISIVILVLLLISLNVWFANALVTLNGVTHQYVESNQMGVSYNLDITPAGAAYGGSVAISSNNLGYINPASGSYAIFAGDQGYRVKMTAYPNEEYKFDYWRINGVNVSNSTQYDFTMSNDTTVEPVFSSQILFNSTKPLYEELMDFAKTINFTGNAVNDGTVPNIGFMIEHLVGAQLGVFSIQDLDNFAASLMVGTSSNSLKAQEILYAYTLLMPYGVTNKTVIQWALDNQPMLSNGLPDTGTALGLKSAFWLEDRYEINGYYWAKLYNYDLSKWNLSFAYNSFETAVDAELNGSPATLYVTSTGKTYSWWGNEHPRYYDECAQTIDAFLRFYQLGITEALSRATNVWNYVNINDWDGDHYGYYVGDDSFECESGGFDQIALKLSYYAPNLQFTDRIITDINTRLIHSGFNSTQWTPSQGALIVHDYAIDGASARLENTIISWASIFGSFNSLDPVSQIKVRNMIDGTDNAFNLTAWQYTLSTDGKYGYSRLYEPYLNLFEWHETSSPSWDFLATSAGESLLILLGITPDTTSLAVPIVDNIYEDMSSTVNPNVIQLNLNTSVLKIPVASEGILDFHYGTNKTSYAFPESGMYSIQFSPDWNTIINVTKIANLPTTYLYYQQALNTETKLNNNSTQLSSCPPTPSSLQNTSSNISLGSKQQTTISANLTSTNSTQPDLSNYQNTEPDLNFVKDLRIWNITLLVDSIILASGTVLCMIVALKNARNCHRKATS
jgi:hypothetical protein